MIVQFRFDEASWSRPEIPYAIETIAPLLDCRYRILPPSVDATPDSPVVFIGEPGRAPANAAVCVLAGPGSAWPRERVVAASFDGAPLLVGPGADVGVASGRELPSAWLRTLAYVLLREEERQTSVRDQWECFSAFQSRLHELALLDRPIVHGLADALGHRIHAWCERHHLTLPGLPRWKGDAPFAAVLSHDVDWTRRFSVVEGLRLLARARGPRSYALRHGLSTIAASLTRDWRQPDPYWSFDRWMEEEARRGYRSAFYFFAERPGRPHPYDATYRYSDPILFQGAQTTIANMMRRMVEGGFEVGLHGSYLSHRDTHELARQRTEVERAVGSPLAGLRQHFLRFDIEATWSAQDGAGFGYDSTLGYNEAIGFRAGLAAPFHPFDPGRGRPLDLLELPVTAMDGVLFRTMRLDGPGAARRIVEHLETVEASRGLAVLLWHPNAADAQAFPGWWEAYLAALDHLGRRGAWVTTPRELTAWWLARAAQAKGGS
jgi:peptidoglycan/xylan/chitin deacetylase (PgdA/CDA1 family)